MSKVVSLQSFKGADKHDASKEKILDAIVAIVTEQDAGSLTIRKVAERAGVSTGTVQHLYNSRAKMFEAVLEKSHFQYLQLLDKDELMSGSLEERCSLFVALAWRHYQGDVFLASQELLLLTRREREMASLVKLSDYLFSIYRKRFRQIFPECQLEDRPLMEVLTSVNCYLTGLAMETILEPKLVNIGGYLRRITRLLVLHLEGEL